MPKNAIYIGKTSVKYQTFLYPKYKNARHNFAYKNYALVITKTHSEAGM